LSTIRFHSALFNLEQWRRPSLPASRSYTWTRHRPCNIRSSINRNPRRLQSRRRRQDRQCRRRHRPPVPVQKYRQLRQPRPKRPLLAPQHATSLRRPRRTTRRQCRARSTAALSWARVTARSRGRCTPEALEKPRAAQGCKAMGDGIEEDGNKAFSFHDWGSRLCQACFLTHLWCQYSTQFGICELMSISIFGVSGVSFISIAIFAISGPESETSNLKAHVSFSWCISKTFPSPAACPTRAPTGRTAAACTGGTVCPRSPPGSFRRV